MATGTDSGEGHGGPRRRDSGGEQGRRLKALRARHGLDQRGLAEKWGISRSTLAEYETGVTIPVTRLADLRQLFPDDLLPGAPLAMPALRDFRDAPALPFAGNVPTTTWEFAPEEAKDLPVDSRLVGPERFQARVVGSSCEPALYENDVVVWKKDANPPAGTVVLAQREGDRGCALRQLRFSYDGDAEMWSLSARHERPNDDQGWEVIAVLVGVERKMGIVTVVFHDDGRPLRLNDLGFPNLNPERKMSE